MRYCSAAAAAAGVLLSALLPGTAGAAPEPAQPRFRDVLASAFVYPFFTDAEVELYLGDTHARVRSQGRPALFRYPGITGLLVDGKPVVAERVGLNLLRATLPAGTHEVAIVTTGTPPALAPAGDGGGVRTAKEFTEDAAGLEPGNELVVADGVYADWQVEVAAEGTAAQPIVIRAQTPGGVTFRRNTRIRLRGKHLVLRGFRFEHCGPGTAVHLVDADDCRVTQCRFHSCGSPTSTFGHIVEVDMGSDRCRVDHCTFTASKSMSLAQRISSTGDLGLDNRFDHNLFRDIYRYWINGQENIQIGQNQRSMSGQCQPRCLVEGNVFDHAWGDGEILSNKSSANIIRHNLAAHCVRSAFTLRGGDGVRFEGNVVVGSDTGLRVMGKRHTIVNNLILDQARWGIYFETGHQDGESNVASEGTLVAHNTIAGCAAGAIAAGGTTETRPHAPKGNTFRNNLLVGTGGILLDTRYLPETVVQRNLLWATGAAQPGNAGEGAVLLDPLLEGSGWEMRPSGKSPAVDRALPVEGVERDRRGAPRQAGAGPDIGADEVGGTPPAGEQVILPPIPPKPLLAPELYRRGPLFVQKPDRPLDGWRAGAGAAAEGDAIHLSDGSADLATPLSESFVLEWQYRPDAFTSTGALVFAADAGGKGYSLTWGGVASDGKPAGVIALRKGTDAAVIADGHDYLYGYQGFRFQRWMGKTPNTSETPNPALWYRFTLLKSGGKLALLLADARRNDPGYPVLLWEDTGAVGGPIPAGGGLRIEQKGGGSWRGFQAWSYGYVGNVPPPAPANLRAEAHGGGRIALRWEGAAGGNTYELHRGAAAGFAPLAATLVASVAGAGAFDDFAVTPSTRYRYQVRVVNRLGLASDFASVVAQAGTGGPLYRVIEAARAQGVTPPLGLSKEGETERTFLWAPPGTPASMAAAPAEGGAEFPLEIAEESDYVIWGLVIAPSEGADSFHVALDAVQGGAFRIWYTGVHPDWQWSKMVPGVRLAAGRHLLRLKHREPGTRLATVLVTNDAEYAP